jgi:hypothetical protein
VVVRQRRLTDPERRQKKQVAIVQGDHTKWEAGRGSPWMAVRGVEKGDAGPLHVVEHERWSEDEA